MFSANTSTLPVITSASSASGSADTPFSFVITTTGSPIPALAEFGALPVGLTFVDNGNGTATISGTPTVTGTFNVTLSASNAAGTGTATLALSIIVPGTSVFSASTVPANVTVNDTTPVELGVKLSSSAAGSITALRFYKGPQNVGTHVADLWSSTGTLLATATFTNETASGWQQVNLPAPVAISAGTTYIASYHTNGFYSGDGNYFATAVANAPLTFPASGASGGNGVYAYGGAGPFPSNSYNATNYYVDVVYSSTTTTLPPVCNNVGGFVATTSTPLTISGVDARRRLLRSEWLRSVAHRRQQPHQWDSDFEQQYRYFHTDSQLCGAGELYQYGFGWSWQQCIGDCHPLGGGSLKLVLDEQCSS